MNTGSIRNKRLLWKERDGYKIMFPLETVTFYCKTFLQLIIQSYIWSSMSFKLLGIYK